MWSNVRNPVTANYFDAHGILHVGGVAAELAAVHTEKQRRAIIDTLVASPALRRIVFGDGNHRVAVSAQFRIATTEFRKWRSVDQEFRDVVRHWSAQQHRAVAVTGYPHVEQVYAHEVLVSVLRSNGLLVLAMVIGLLAYFQRVPDLVSALRD
jgi:hypothetical protein